MTTPRPYWGYSQNELCEGEPELESCSGCGADWYPVFSVTQERGPWERRHRNDCAKKPMTVLSQHEASLPAPDDALPDEELEGYVLGVRDALKILRGEKPDKLDRDDLWWGDARTR